MIKRNFALLGIAFLFILQYAATIYLSGGIVGAGDGGLLFYPSEWALARSLDNGTLPFWVPELGAGFPLLADGQPGLLYPFNQLLFGLLPVYLAHNLNFLFHGFLGLYLVFLWGRSISISNHASALMGFIYVSTTPLIGGNVPMQQTLVWTPLLFLLTERLVQNKKNAVLAGISILIGLQWLAGFPQYTVYSAVAAAIYLLVRLWKSTNDLKRTAFLFSGWGAAVILGALLAAIQLIPTWELSQWSVRAGGLKGSIAGYGSLFPGTLITYWLPSTMKFFGSSGLGSGRYLGTIPLAFALSFLISSRRNNPYRTALLFSILFTILLSFGRYSPLYPIIKQIPFLAAFRVPSRFLILSQFGLVTLFGLGFDRFNHESIKKWTIRAFRLSIFFLGLLPTIIHPLILSNREVLIRSANWIVTRFILGDEFHLQSSGYYTEKINQLFQDLLAFTSIEHPLIWVPFLVSILALFIWNGKNTTRIYLWTLLIVVELLTFSISSTPTQQEKYITSPPPTVSIVHSNLHDKLCRTFWVVDSEGIGSSTENLKLLPANYSIIYGFSSTGIVSPLASFDYFKLMEPLSTVNLAYGIADIPTENLMKHRELLNLVNACVVLSRIPLDNFDLVGETDDVFIYSNPDAYKSAFVVDQVKVFDSDDSILAWLHSEKLDFSASAALKSPLNAPLSDGAAEKAIVTISKYEATTVEIEISTPGNVFLVFTDLMAPGWHAYLDGEEVDIYTTNLVFRGLYVPSGTHLIKMEYTPQAFLIGTWISAVALMLWLTWLLFLVRSHRRVEV